ncbi:hypothetical protein [Flavobacterium sp.]|uniref:hypothetical protein n=1 Tax=Flavobacterium sp. TaxID=239 RepID=UPI00286D95B5|nr:hypothetical protein [Flavobacterium sp.]
MVINSNNQQVKYLFLGIVFLFLFFKYIEIGNLYIFNGDGPWSLSQTLSMLNNEWGWSRFAHEPDGQIYQNYSYAILFYIPFKLFGVSHYSYLSAYFFYLILTLIGIYKIFKGNSFLQFFVSMFFVSSVYTYNFRFEALAIVFMVWGLYFIFKKGKWIYLAFFLFSWAALIHPATFVALFFVIGHYLYLEKKLLDYKTIGLYLMVFVFFVFLLLGFDINNLLDPIFVRPELKQRFLVIRPENIIKWLTLSGVFVWGIIVLIRKTSIVSVVFVGLNIMVYLIFKKSYYYPYLLLHIILLLYYKRNEITIHPIFKIGFYIHLLVFGVLFFIFPVYKSYENPEYGKTMRNNVEYLTKISQKMFPNQRIYVEKELIMGISNNKNARLYLNEYSDYYNGSPKINLNQKDKIYFFRQKQLESFKEKMASVIYQKKVIIRQIHKPVKGILAFKGRSDGIGLWEISVN